mmetsp:Transcript_40599/g.81952  ORF Transcript_40599/g.81952 Transcript_40599/m.81952 type:complete len:256 (+) Transcript_40599:108-875(+)
MAALEHTFATIIYANEELAAIREVKAALLGKGVDESRIGLRSLALTTVNTKCRVAEATDKYIKWLETVEKFGIKGLADEEYNDAVAHMLSSYAMCGLDARGSSIFWIKGGVIEKDQETAAILCGIMYFMAIHADNVSLHEGISFVIDVANQPPKKVGNEQKMQNAWQVFPLRPQRIFISGAGTIKRALINTLLKVASFFTKQKILERIRFATMDEVLTEIPIKSAPLYVGGEGGCVNDIAAWVKGRLDAFPVPEL